MNLNELLAKRARVWEDMKETLDVPQREGRDITAEERAKYDAAEKDLEQVTNDIDTAKRHAERAKELDTKIEDTNSQIKESQRSGEDPENLAYREAFITYITRGREALDSDQRSALQAGYQVEGRAQSVGTTTAGGYLVPQGFRAELIRQLKSFGNVRAVAQNITTDTGNTLPWPTMNDTTNTGSLLAENTQLTETDVVFGQAQLGAYMFTSDLVLVSEQFLEDAPWVDAEAMLSSVLGERISRGQNAYFTTGTGSSQPQGIVTGAANGVTAANSTSQVTAITYGSLVDLIHSVDAAYRQTGRCAFMLNDATLAAFRKLVDSQNRPLWEPSVQNGEPDTILGYPIIVNNQMATMAASAKSILFGDFQSGYVVRDVRDIQIRRLNERYADYLQVGFFGFARADGKVQNTSAYKSFINAAS